MAKFEHGWLDIPFSMTGRPLDISWLVVGQEREWPLRTTERKPGQKRTVQEIVRARDELIVRLGQEGWELVTAHKLERFYFKRRID